MKKSRKNGRGVVQDGRSKKEAPYMRVFFWMFDSVAFQSLTPKARSLILSLSRLYYGGNNGKIFLSYRDAARISGFSKNTAKEAFEELIQKGFVKALVKGSFNVKQPHATTWILTWWPSHDGRVATKEFMRKGMANIFLKNKIRNKPLTATVAEFDQNPDNHLVAVPNIVPQEL